MKVAALRLTAKV